MKRKEVQHRRKHLSNRRLSESYSYSGIHETPIAIRLIQYNAKSEQVRDVKPTEMFSKIASPDTVNWFQVSGLNDATAIERIVRDFGMHHMDTKEILTPQHVVKIDEYNHRFLLILNSCSYDADKELQTEHISVLASGNTLITFTESDNPVFAYAEKAIRTNMLDMREKGGGMLLAFLLNTVIANLVESVSIVEELLEDMEEILLDISKDQSNVGNLIQERRRDYILIRKSSQPLKEQFTKLTHSDNALITPELEPVFNDLADQLTFISQTMEGCREVISSLVDMFISNNDLRMNAIMKRLTIVSTIFIPLTFLAGVWGMNFSFMPELGWRYGYALAWLLMICCGLATGWYLKRKNWN